MSKLEQKLKEWHKLNLLDDDSLNRILDYERHQGKVEKQSFLGNIVPFLIALLVAFAILALVGSNWNEYSQTMRLVIIFVTLFVFHAVAFISYQKGKELFGHCLNFINAIGYACAFVLIVQMYQFSSDSPVFLITWTMLAFLYYYVLKHDMFYYLFLGIGFFSLSYSAGIDTVHVYLLQIPLLLCSIYFLKIMKNRWSVSFNYSFLGYIIIMFFQTISNRQYFIPIILVVFILWYLNERGVIDYVLLPVFTIFVWFFTYFTTTFGGLYDVAHELQKEFSYGFLKPVAVPLFDAIILLILILAIYTAYKKWKNNVAMKNQLWIFLFIFLLPILGVQDKLANMIVGVLILFAYSCIRLFNGVSGHERGSIIIGFITFAALVIGIYTGLAVSFISKSIVFIILAIALYLVFLQSKKARGDEHAK
ncbi:DUF2157 domain-containing protein [Bacillus sp. AFS017336]|uniref:DUF2157 domain-containing protein n=1 Tax=Bacillus sp. AFS017336 TaxID=2033489 RepID=UPI000BF06AC0|nr:DUF2157 domain-containing protein [Bacillus sp. AFS017336]PEL08139.1 hypothetical protein CN601_17895 [Bacillus sp. AFS017336]